MQSSSVSAGKPALIEVHPDFRTTYWHPADSTGVTEARTVPWFPSLGLLDYADGSGPVPPRHANAPSMPSPVFGDPLIVRTDLAAVFWRASSVLHSAPIRHGCVNLVHGSAVDWTTTGAHHDVVQVVEHNLAQCSDALPTLDPPLHVVQVDRSGRLSLSYLVADVDGSPVIGPTPPHYQPFLPLSRVQAAASHGLPSVAAMWEEALRRRTTDGGWRFVPPERALDTLADAGFTVTSAVSERPGLVAALRAAEGSQWVSGWYGGTRLLTLARFERNPYGGDLHYDFHRPGSRRAAVAGTGSGHGIGDRVDMRGPADVESRPHDERVYVEGAQGRSGMATPVEAGRVALHEPVLIDGPMPVVDHEVKWTAVCRRCTVPMSCDLLGPHDFVPYVHELTARMPDRGSLVWCAEHPTQDRRRPHAPVCRVIEHPRP